MLASCERREGEEGKEERERGRERERGMVDGRAAPAALASSSKKHKTKQKRNNSKKTAKTRQQRASLSAKQTEERREPRIYVPAITRVTVSSPPLSSATSSSSSSVFAGQCSGVWGGTAAEVNPRTGKLETMPANESSRLHAGVITVDSPAPASLRRSLCLLSSLSASSSSQTILDAQRDAASSWLEDMSTSEDSSPHISTETSAVVDTLGTLSFSDGSYTLGPEQLDVTGAPMSLEFCIAANHTRVHSRVRVIVKLRLFAESSLEEHREDDGNDTECGIHNEEDEMSLDVFGVRVVREDWIAPSVAVKARRNYIVNYALEQGSSENMRHEQTLSWMSSSDAHRKRRWTYSQTRADVLEDSDSEDDDDDEEDDKEQQEDEVDDGEEQRNNVRHKAVWTTFRGEMFFCPPADTAERQMAGTGVVLPHGAGLELAPLPEGGMDVRVRWSPSPDVLTTITRSYNRRGFLMGSSHSSSSPLPSGSELDSSSVDTSSNTATAARA